MANYALSKVDDKTYSVIKDGIPTYTIKFKSKAWSCDCPARKECKHLRLLPEDALVKRYPRDEITIAVRALQPYLPPTFEVVGSYRRGLPTCKDMDILMKCTPEEFETVKLLLPHESAGERIIRGTFEGIPFDIEWVSEEDWASYLLYRTGSKILNIKMRQRAKDLGRILNEHGIDGMPYSSEEAIFKALGLKYLPPEQRDLK